MISAGSHRPSGAMAAPARSAASSLSRAQSRSAARRALTNTMVDRCAWIRSSTRSSTAGQIDARRGPSSSPGSFGDRGPAGRLVMSSTGTCTVTSMVFALFGATISTGAAPPRKCAVSSTGRTVADRPIRWAGRGSSASSRSSDSARWAPRLVAQTACTSSRITVSTPRSDSRADEVSSRNNDSGVVIRMSGGRLAKARRSCVGVSPVRMPTVMSGGAMPSRCAACRMPVSGVRRLRSTSTAKALSGLT
jgi:hypothetical protein